MSAICNLLQFLAFEKVNKFTVGFLDNDVCSARQMKLNVEKYVR